MTRAEPFGIEQVGPHDAFVLTPERRRMFLTTLARARGIAAALNTPEGRTAFEGARNGV